MSNALSFRKNLSWTLIGQAFNVLAQFAIVISISRIADVETVGFYGIISAIVSPVQLFLMLDLGKLLVTSENFNQEFPHYHWVIIMASLLIPLVSAILCLVIYQDLSMLPVIIAFALFRAMVNYREFCYAVYQRFERLDHMGKSMMWLSLGTILLFILGYYFFRSLTISFLGLFILYTVSLFFIELPRMKKFLEPGNSLLSFDRTAIFKILRNAVPMGGTAFATSFKSNIPRYLIEFGLQDRAILGFYTAFLQIVNALGYLNQALAKTAIGKLNNLYKSNIHRFNAFLKKMLIASTGVGLAAFILTVVGGSFLSTIVFGKEYGSYNYIFIFLVLARLLVMPATYLKIVQVLIGQINVQFWIMLISMALLSLLGYFLMKMFLDTGILIALALSELFVLIATALQVKKGFIYANR